MRRIVPLALVMVMAACGSTPDPVPDASTTTTSGSEASGSSTTTSAAAVDTTTTSSTTTTGLPELQGVAWEEVARADGFVTGFAVLDGELLVAIKDGRVTHLDGSTLIDISGDVNDGGERGLLDIAVHPDFPDDARLWVHHSARNGDTVLREFTLSDGAVVDDVVVFEHDQPAGNHNGGSLEFGTDGMLYLGLGDGGGGGDRYGHGQRTDTHLAGILRFDVASPGEVTAPPDNPFPDAEFLWVYGLRNPWRFTFDGDDLWIADVGQNRWEEVNRLDAATAAGANLGWPVLEGAECYETGDCDRSGMVAPVAVVEHGDDGTCSITGGVVYRGAAIPELAGHYFLSDFCGGWLRSVTGDEVTSWDVERLDQPATFGFDPDGEILVSGADGLIRRLTALR